MNRIYKVIWNRARHCYVVVSELATRSGKEKSRHLTVAARLAAAVICAGALSLGMGLFNWRRQQNLLQPVRPRISMWRFL